MRKINTHDVFNALRLIQRTGIKEELTPVIKEISEKGSEVIDAGILGILTILETVSAEKNERVIYEFLSGPFEMDPEEIETMELEQFTAAVEWLESENDLGRFFHALSGLLTKKP